MEELYSSQPRTEIVDLDFRGMNGDDSEFMNGISEFESNKAYTCDYCGLPCSSAKSLLRHKKLIHETARTCFLCPCCKSTFPNTWSVHRHLFKVHHKTNEQVRKLRSQIKTKVVQPGENVKALPDKMKLAQQKISDQQKWDLENEEWLDHLGKDVDLLRCGSCSRKFERRAALKAHYQICQKRTNVINVNSTAHYRATPEKETNSPDSKPKSITENLKLLPVVALTALTPAQIKEKSQAPEKKIGIQVRMDYCKNSSSNSLTSERLSAFDKPNTIDVITVDDDRTIEKPKSCLETLLTKKRNNRSDSGNDSESQDDISIALDFSSDSVVDEDTIKLNMYDILGISSTESNSDTAFDSSLNVESMNCDKFINRSTAIPNKRKKVCPVKRSIFNAENDSDKCFNAENDLNSDNDKRSEVWSEKSNDLVFRRENVKVTYTNCKLKSNKTELEKVNHFNNPPNPFCPELVEKLANYYNKTNGICLLCNNQYDPVNILRHITEHGNWLKFRCKWPECEFESSTKIALIKHISKSHKGLNGEIIAHDFVELISRKDWKFSVAISADSYHKKCNVLLDKVSKLKERLNGSGKLLEAVISKKCVTSASGVPEKEQDGNSQVVSMETTVTEEVETKVELMEVDTSSSEMDTADLNSSVDDKDCEISSAKLYSQNNESDPENSSHSERFNEEVVNSNRVSQMSDVVPGDEIVDNGCEELETCIVSNADLNKAMELPTDSSSLNNTEKSPEVVVDSSEKEESSVMPVISNEEEKGPFRFRIPEDLNEEEVSSIIPEGLNEEEVSSVIPEGLNEEEVSSVIPEGLNEEEVSSVIPEGLNDEEVSSVIPEGLNEEEVSSVITEGVNEEEVSSVITEGVNEEEVSSVIPEGLIEEEISSVIPEGLIEEEVSSVTPECLIEEEVSSVTPEGLIEEEVSSVTPEDLNEEEASPVTPDGLKDEDASLVTPEDVKEEDACSVISLSSDDLEESFITLDEVTDEEVDMMHCDVPIKEEEEESPKSSDDCNEENQVEEASSASVEEKAVESPATVSEDDFMSDSHCADTGDADQSCSVFDKSETGELDDDHLRAVMMEMIFGGTSEEFTSPLNEYMEKNRSGSKRRKLDTELNV